MLAVVQLLQRVRSEFGVLVLLPELLPPNSEGPLENRPCLAVVSLHAWGGRRAKGTHLPVQLHLASALQLP